MSCVNISHPEFIELTKALDLHPSFLEPIIHVYQNSSKENEDKFPPIEYFTEGILVSKFKTTSPFEIKFWKSYYKVPRVFNSLSEAANYIEDNFPEVYKKYMDISLTKNGKYKVASKILIPMYRNKIDENTLLNILREIRWLEGFKDNHEEWHHLITFEKGSWRITLGDDWSKNFNEADIKNHFKNKLQELGLPKELFDISPKKGDAHFLEIKFNKNVKQKLEDLLNENTKKEIIDSTDYYTDKELKILKERNLKVLDSFSGNNISEIIQQFKDNVLKTIEAYNEAHHYDLGISTTSKSIFSDYIKDSNSYYNYIETLSTNIISKLESEGKSISIVPSETLGSAMAVSIKDNAIILQFNPELITIEYSRLDYIIAHELVHTVTSTAVNNVVLGIATKEEQGFVDSIWNILLELESKENFYWDFGFNINNIQDKAKYIKEFIANVMTNPALQSNLAEIKLNDNTSIWSKFILAIKNLLNKYLGKDINNTYLERLINTISVHIEQTSITDTVKDAFTEGTQKNTDIKYLEQSTRILSQIDNLFSSNIIPSSEVRAIANKVAYFISDLITEIQTKPGFAASKFGESYKDIDFSTLTRKDIVRFIGIDNIVLAAKQQFHPSKIVSDDRKIIAQARLLQKNWEAIMQLAGPEFSRLEKFNITPIDDNLDREILEEEDTDGYNEESITQEIEGSTQEHWQIENRTIEIVNSLSQEMRNALLQCYILAPDGFERGQRKYKKVQDKWGINERIPVKDAVNSILRWTQGSITLNDMISKLKEKRSKNPWISQIISRLEDTSGKEADFQSQFFSVFDLHFQAYSVGTDKDGKYTVSIVNENPALKEVMDTITVLYNMGDHPLFTPKGIDREVYNSLHTTIDKLLKIDFESYDLDKLATLIQESLNNLGYSISSKEVLETLNLDSFNIIKRALKGIDDAVTANLNNKSYQPFAFKSEGSIRGYTQNLLQPFTDKLEDITVQTTYSNGKMYQGYVTPSYLSKLMLKFKQRGEAFDTFIQEEYGEYEWFKKDTGDIETGWRNLWLKELVTDTDARDIFKHTVNLSWNGKYYMRNMSDMEYLLSVFSMYFSSSSKKEKVPAWFRVPMMSNKPSSEYIRFYSYRGSNYKDTITYGLKMVFDQELSRIQTVLMRNYDKSNPRFIKNFDKNGKKFNLLTYMNDYLEGGSKQNTELGKLIQRKIKGEQVDEVRLNTLAIATIKETMEAKAKSILDDWINKGVIEAAKNIANIPDDKIYESLENFIWNDTFASINIMELTITDPAYYKDAEDIQKRFAQIHAPGVRGNKDATDYNGERVSDGKERTIYLTDFDDFKSNIIENLKIVFDRKIAEAPESQKEQYKALKESIIKQYEEINVADAQAYNSPISYRKKAFIFGKWSRDKEIVYERLMSGDFSYSDIQEAFQPLKPFKYTQMSKESHVENAPMSKLKVPVQNKNAEYLLVLAGAILQGQDTGRPNLLRAIYTVMKESAEKNPTKGIDTVQFTSAVKSGEMGDIDIKQFYDNSNGEALALAELRTAVYNSDGSYNTDRVHETSFEDYCLQQEVPPHFLDHEQIHGSQVRYIVLGDLETLDYLGNAVTYNVEGRQLTADEFKAEYEQTIAENIKESIEELSRELNVTGDRRNRNLALSQILQREIASSPRYGVDLMLACSLDENGEFKLPLGDPTQAKRIEQLINSIIKNRVNKQTITGGPVVQVSNFGTSRQLNIRFKDKNGNIIDRSKFNSDEEYKEYLKENQAGVAYFECFAPAYTKDIFLHFTKENGDIDTEAIEKLNPELLKMIGYRIPTENKYSIIPMKIVGFLPKEAGDGIMLPNDITLITGSDFDVKLY